MEVLLGLLLSYLTQFLKNYIEPKFGKSGVRNFVLLFSLLGSFAYFIIQQDQALLDMIKSSLRDFAVISGVAIGWYEVFLKRLAQKRRTILLRKY